MSNLAGHRIKDTYDGVLHASGSSLTRGDGTSTNTIDAVFNTVDVAVGGLKEGGTSHTSVSATTSVAGHVELATDAEAHAATDTTRAVSPSSLLIKKDSTAIVAGDLTGNSRGSNALDIQSNRSAATQVASGINSSAVGYRNTASGFSGSSAIGFSNIASGTNSSAFGRSNTASASGASALGYGNTASQASSSAFGYSNTASAAFGASAFGFSNTADGFASTALGNQNTSSGAGSIAVGYGNTASSSYDSSAFGYGNMADGISSVAIGRSNTASGSSSTAIGYSAKTTVNFTFEAGYWSNSTTRGGGIRCHPNGQVAMTIEDSASAPTDGGATAGSEADGTLARGMFTIQKNGNAVTLYYNNGVNIQSLSLGTLS